jgi:hypothetical protein
VEAGRNVSVVIGELVYDGPPISMQLIFIILGCVMAVVGIIVVTIVFTYRHKSRQRDLSLNRQMDNKEASMAKECKEGTLLCTAVGCCHNRFRETVKVDFIMRVLQHLPSSRQTRRNLLVTFQA